MMKRMAVVAAFWTVLSVSAEAVAADMGQGSMGGSHGGMTMEGHDMMSMGDLVFKGKIGPWEAEARLIDMRAEMEKAKVSEKMMAMIRNPHHLAVSLEDPATKTLVTKGQGTVTVVGPGGTRAGYNLVEMQAHFGSDVILDKPGRYTFEVRIEAEGKTGTASFDYEMK